LPFFNEEPEMIPHLRKVNPLELIYGWRMQQINFGRGPTTAEPVACRQAVSLVTGQQFVCTFQNQQHFAYIDVHRNVWDCFYDGGDTWTALQINGGDLGAPPAGSYGNAPMLCAFGDQLHFVYVDENFNLQDCFVDGVPTGSPSSPQWQLRQINGPKPQASSETVVCPLAPPVGQGSLQASPWPGGVYQFGDQLHFTYVDDQFNVQDCYYDGGTNWIVQQINNSEGSGPTVTGPPPELVACTAATASAGSLSVGVLGSQRHIVYVDGANNLWDVYNDGDSSQWNVQRINNGGVSTAQPAPDVLEGGTVSVCTFGNALHVTYIDSNNNLQDCIYDDGLWTLQQINGGQPTAAGEPVCFPDAPPVNTAASAWSVCVFGDQLHYVYVDENNNLQDCWYGWRSYGNSLPGSLYVWDVVQLTGKGGVYPDAPAFGDTGTLSVCAYGTQLHITYTDNQFNLQDIYWVSFPGEIGLTGGNAERLPVAQGMGSG
jgi:hypothetical protein